MPIGSLMLDIEGLSLTDGEAELLREEQVGGIILFARNYEAPEQLGRLVKEIRNIRPEILLAVDHEGGRVQRFLEGFTRIPPMSTLGQLYCKNKKKALHTARETAWLLATELLLQDIDLSFAPVLDLDHSLSQVIGDRAFANDPSVVIDLGQAFVDGFHDAGMAATGKHFPGHGGVVGDSHTDIPVDHRNWSEIESTDLLPFRQLAGSLDAVMPAHVIYSEIDSHPAGFSEVWLKEILRGKLGFDGVIFSDDLSMEGATVAGSYTERAQAAMQAGCDMVLVCNDRNGAIEVLEYLKRHKVKSSTRLHRLKHHTKLNRSTLQTSKALAAVDMVKSIRS